MKLLLAVVVLFCTVFSFAENLRDSLMSRMHKIEFDFARCIHEFERLYDEGRDESYVSNLERAIENEKDRESGVQSWIELLEIFSDSFLKGNREFVIDETNMYKFTQIQCEANLNNWKAWLARRYLYDKHAGSSDGESIPEAPRPPMSY